MRKNAENYNDFDDEIYKDRKLKSYKNKKTHSFKKNQLELDELYTSRTSYRRASNKSLRKAHFFDTDLLL